jgi:hypothetical protein
MTTFISVSAQTLSNSLHVHDTILESADLEFQAFFEAVLEKYKNLTVGRLWWKRTATQKDIIKLITGASYKYLLSDEQRRELAEIMLVIDIGLEETMFIQHIYQLQVYRQGSYIKRIKHADVVEQIKNILYLASDMETAVLVDSNVQKFMVDMDEVVLSLGNTDSSSYHVEDDTPVIH